MPRIATSAVQNRLSVAGQTQFRRIAVANDVQYRRLAAGGVNAVVIGHLIGKQSTAEGRRFALLEEGQALDEVRDAAKRALRQTCRRLLKGAFKTCTHDCVDGLVDSTHAVDSGLRQLGRTHLTGCYQASESNRVEASIFIKVHASLLVVARRAGSLRWWFRVERQVVAPHVAIASLSILSDVGCYFAKRREPDIAF